MLFKNYSQPWVSEGDWFQEAKGYQKSVDTPDPYILNKGTYLS